MTNEQILLAAIEKSRKNGWKKYGYDYVGDYYNESSQTFSTDRRITHFNEILFDKEFWKALVGEGKINTEDFFDMPEDHDKCDPSAHDNWYVGGGYQGYGDYLEFKGVAWQYHMQQIALEDERIKYLKRFI